MGKIMERKYVCANGVVERTRFAVGDNTAEHRGWRKARENPYTQEKQEENQRLEVRKLARIMNCNLDSSGFLVTLNYTETAYGKLFAEMEEDQILEESNHQAALFLRRLKRKAGDGLKSVYASSDRERNEDGELEPARIHIHLVIMGATVEQIRDSWSHGDCTDVRSIYEHQEDYTPLAVYILEQVRWRSGKKRYNCSRNMEKPKVYDRVIVGDAGDEIRVQPGAKVLDRSAHTEGTVVQYVRYLKRPGSRKRGGHKEKQAEGTENFMGGISQCTSFEKSGG